MKQKDDAKTWDGKNGGTEMEDARMNENTEINENELSLPDAESAEADPLVKMEVELSEYKDKYLRLYSEFENYKKRVLRDRAEQLKFGAMDTYLAFLPVIDDFERAQKSMGEATDLDSVRQGVQLIYQKLKAVTEARGLKPMDAIGKPFDPELHDAISNVPAQSEDQKGLVIDEVEKGYFLNDKVLRHAKVIVAN